MSRKLLMTALSFLALTVLAGTAFVPASSALPGHAVAGAQHKPSGLTPQGIVNAKKAGTPSRLVTMAPQSSFKLLSRATKVGPHALSSTIKLTVALKLRNEVKLNSYLEQVQNPHSPVYHQWLTPEQFTTRYGPSEVDVARVEAFLKAHGIKVEGVSRNRILIHTEATTAAYEHALGVRINDYKLNERSFYSTTDSPKLPRALASLVGGILGLNHGARMHSHLSRQTTVVRSSEAPPPATTGAYLNQLQMAKAYDWPSLTDTNNGAGVTIAILSYASADFDMSDVHGYWSGLGLPDHDVSIVNVDGMPVVGGAGETTLDLEYSGAMAPGANIILYRGNNPSFGTTADVINAMVSADVADVASTSWGACEWAVPNISAIEPLLKQVAAQGISMSAAAGDGGSSDNRFINGSYTCDNGSNDNADFPSSSPYVLAANGTSLTISDTSGTYGSETAWPETGGANSSVFAQPSWQTGSGVPNSGNLMNGDMAMHAGGESGLLLYFRGQWGTNGGTSFVAPEFAGLSADVDSASGVRMGQINSLIYNDVNAGNYASDFRDVTSGSNGAFQAGPDWDYPTGWGSPKAANLIAHIDIPGPKGTLAGKVTAATSGSAIAGAQIMATGPGANSRTFAVASASDGSYSQVLPVGSFSVTVSDYGFQSITQQESIGEGRTTTQNFQLQPAPKVALHGRVTDGSGHEYGLYAEIKVSVAGIGQVADVWTNPVTGKYSIKLPEDTKYTMKVAAGLDGYHMAGAAVNLDGNTTKNFALGVTSTCSAPGYVFKNGGLSEDFNGGTFPPSGWSLAGGPPAVAWKLSSEEPVHNGNYTGGTGDAASANAAAESGTLSPFDVHLFFPPIPVTSLHGATVLRYKANYHNYDGEDALDLVMFSARGKEVISHWTTSHGSFLGTPGYDVHVNLAPYLPNQGNFQLTWHYYNHSNNHGWYAQVDDVTIGGCQPIPGGLTYGQVTDSNTGNGIVGAKVADGAGDSAKTIRNPDDPSLPAGSYLIFTPSSATTLTASYGRYTPMAVPITVQNNQVQTQNFSLKAAKFTTDPARFDLHVMVNSQVTKTLTIDNSGNGAGQFKILAIDAAPPSTASAVRAITPLRTVKGHFTMASHMYESSHGLKPDGAVDASPRVLPQPFDAPWTNIADLPSAIQDNLAATDPLTGKVYSIYGYDGSVDTGAGFVYDPSSDSWSAIATAPNTRENPAGGFINGKLYVTGGYGPNPATLAIYDPNSDSWSTGADDPNPVTGGVAGAVLNGKLYVVGGCSPGSCSTQAKTVEVYDPSTDSWSAAAPYPHGVTFTQCGVIAGKLYCAGGGGASGQIYTDGYVYDPSTDSWSPIADMPTGLVGGGYIASQGKLLISGGEITGAITNQGYAYDPASDSWTALPNANTARFRGGSSCGFYLIGGEGSGGAPVASGEVLPGYSSCGMNGIPWLTIAPTSATLAVGATAKVTLTFDGSKQKEFTTSQGYLSLSGSPYPNLIVPLTVTWDPQPIDLSVGGSVSPTGTVDANDYLSYTIAVQNLPDAKGAASQTKLIYEIPSNVNYIGINGATCTQSPASDGDHAAGIVGTPVAASVAGPALVTCDLGTIKPNGSKVVTVAVRATAAASSIGATFKVSAREPDSNMGNNSMTLDTNPAVGPPGSPGPTGPQGPKGDEGSGSLAFGGLVLLALLALSVGVVETRKRRRANTIV